MVPGEAGRERATPGAVARVMDEVVDTIVRVTLPRRRARRQAELYRRAAEIAREALQTFLPEMLYQVDRAFSAADAMIEGELGAASALEEIKAAEQRVAELAGFMNAEGERCAEKFAEAEEAEQL